MLQENSPLYHLRHSLAHVLACAVKEHFPKVKFGFGPPVPYGFFYDFDFSDGPELRQEDLKTIQKTMIRLINKGFHFEKVTCSIDQAKDKLAELMGPGQVYKEKQIDKLKEEGFKEVTFYGKEFWDLCKGGHVDDKIHPKCFQLDRIAGSFFMGDESQTMLTRIYGLAFESPEILKDFLQKREELKKYDHKKLGNQLQIYTQSDLVGKGLILWLPHGATIRREIERYAEEIEERHGYQRVSTPHIAKENLFLTSGHLPSYEDSMFAPIETEEQEKYYLKPMNCPMHHLIFDHGLKSYRDLPVRLAEYGMIYRYEQSGELSGLLRVRGMCLNDAHIYVREDQIENEIIEVLEIYNELFSTFKLTQKYRLRLSVRDPESPKFQGAQELWDNSERQLRNALEKLQLPYEIGFGEAAFYGPKIDFQFKNLMGREETLSTIQVDYQAAKKFGLKYIDHEGHEKEPIVIHRSPLSTHERFISLLLEYYGGAFPLWCSPVQVAWVPVGEKHHAFCAERSKALCELGMRSKIDTSGDSFSKKIRTHTVQKTPIILVVGDKEMDSDTVNVRRYGVQDQYSENFENFKAATLDEIQNRKFNREPFGGLDFD